MVRYVVFHIEQTQGMRVLKMNIEFMTDINGQYHLKLINTLFLSSVYPWAPTNWEPTHQVTLTLSNKSILPSGFR